MKPLTRSNEPVAWSLFGAGGMVVAFVLPALVVITGFLLPLGADGSDASSYIRMLSFAQSWPGAIFLLLSISLPLFHAAHRIYHGLHDLHVHGSPAVMVMVCYGGATVLSLMALASLFTLHQALP